MVNLIEYNNLINHNNKYICYRYKLIDISQDHLLSLNLFIILNKMDIKKD